MNLVTVYNGLNLAETQLVRARLEAAGFHAVIQHELAALSFEGYALGTGGIPVQVLEAEAADAKELLAAEDSGAQ